MICIFYLLKYNILEYTYFILSYSYFVNFKLIDIVDTQPIKCVVKYTN